MPGDGGFFHIMIIFWVFFTPNQGMPGWGLVTSKDVRVVETEEARSPGATRWLTRVPIRVVHPVTTG